MTINKQRTHAPRYGTAKTACYLAYVTQAALINLWPLFFIIFRETFGLSYLELATLAGLNFAVQLGTDLAFAKAADKHGFRPFLLLSSGLVAIGFLVFAAVPLLTDNPYPGFIAATVIFSLGGGLTDIMASPLIDLIPHESKSGNMAFFHSMYAWGQAGVILLTSLALKLFGDAAWQLIVVFWALIPILQFILFLRAPMPDIQAKSKQSAREIAKGSDFIICFFIIFFGAGVECTMVQWSSAFMEQAVGLPKLLGDYAGVLMFALMLGLSRLLHGLFSKKIDLVKYMLAGAAGAILFYPLTAFSNVPALNLIGCALTGFGAGMLWPGTLVLASERYPRGGAWLFAIMAVGGDSGAAFCPWLSGLLADNAAKIPLFANLGAGLTPEQLGLRSAIGFSTLYPIIAAVLLIVFMRRRQRRIEGGIQA